MADAPTPSTTLNEADARELLDLQLAEMTDRERLFVMAYMRTRSASQAYRDAGYEPSATNAWSLLKKPVVAAAIASLTLARLRRLQITPQRIEEELAKVAFASLGAMMRIQEDGTAYLDMAQADDIDLAGLASFKCEIEHVPGGDPDAPKSVLKMEAKLWPKVEALGKLAQIHKMISGDVQVAVTVDVADEIRRKRREKAGLPPAEGNG